MADFNTNVFTVEDTENNFTYLIIRTTVLENFETFESLGTLVLASEALGSYWGYSIDTGNTLSKALFNVNLDSDLYRYNTLEEEVSEKCLERVRDLLGVKSMSTATSRFKFQ